MFAKKLISSHHCKAVHRSRVVYRSDFVNKQLFEKNVIDKLRKLPVCQKSLYSDVVKRFSDRSLPGKVHAATVKSDNSGPTNMVSRTDSCGLAKNASPYRLVSLKSAVSRRPGTNARFCNKVTKMHVEQPIEIKNRFSPLTSVSEVLSNNNVHTVVNDGGRIRKRVYSYGKSGGSNNSPPKSLTNIKRTGNVCTNVKMEKILPVCSGLSDRSCITGKSDSKKLSGWC